MQSCSGVSYLTGRVTGFGGARGWELRGLRGRILQLRLYDAGRSQKREVHVKAGKRWSLGGAGVVPKVAAVSSEASNPGVFPMVLNFSFMASGLSFIVGAIF